MPFAGIDAERLEEGENCVVERGGESGRDICHQLGAGFFAGLESV